ADRELDEVRVAQLVACVVEGAAHRPSDRAEEDGEGDELQRDEGARVSLEYAHPAMVRRYIRLIESTLPFAWYRDPEILRLEQERVFRGTWQYVGHIGEAPEPGAYFTARAGRTPIVVTRDRDGALRGFLN